MLKKSLVSVAKSDPLDFALNVESFEETDLTKEPINFDAMMLLGTRKR